MIGSNVEPLMFLSGQWKPGCYHPTSAGSREVVSGHCSHQADQYIYFPEGVTVIRAVFEESELAKALEGQDAVVSTVGANGFQGQKVLINAAIKAGVKRFIPSELSSNTLSAAVRQLVPVFEHKKAVLDYLKEKEYTGLTWTGIAVGALFDWVRLSRVYYSHSKLT